MFTANFCVNSSVLQARKYNEKDYHIKCSTRLKYKRKTKCLTQNSVLLSLTNCSRNCGKEYWRNYMRRIFIETLDEVNAEG